MVELCDDEPFDFADPGVEICFLSFGSGELKEDNDGLFFAATELSSEIKNGMLASFHE